MRRVIKKRHYIERPTNSPDALNMMIDDLVDEVEGLPKNDPKRSDKVKELDTLIKQSIWAQTREVAKTVYDSGLVDQLAVDRFLRWGIDKVMSDRVTRGTYNDVDKLSVLFYKMNEGPRVEDYMQDHEVAERERVLSEKDAYEFLKNVYVHGKDEGEVPFHIENIYPEIKAKLKLDLHYDDINLDNADKLNKFKKKMFYNENMRAIVEKRLQELSAREQIVQQTEDRVRASRDFQSDAQIYSKLKDLVGKQVDQIRKTYNRQIRE